MHVALASCLTLPEADLDEAPLIAALRACGLEARSLAWDDPSSDFAAAQLTLLRATWNYPEQPERFLQWVEAVNGLTQLCNSAAVVRWNIHKGYLLELAARGVPIVPTELVHGSAEERLPDICARRGFRDVVVKPAISAGSRGTKRFTFEQLEIGDAHLRALTAQGDALVQPYLPAIETHGERSMIWIDGVVTHAVRKSPRFAGHEERIDPVDEITREERALAERAVASVGQSLFYARADVVPDASGAPVLMELELIEPSLFFAQSESALARFVAGVLARIGMSHKA